LLATPVKQKIVEGRLDLKLEPNALVLVKVKQ